MLNEFAAFEALEPIQVWTVRLFLLGLLVVVSRSDFRFRRIPNRAVALGAMVAFAWHGIAPLGSGLFDRYDPGALGIVASLSGAVGAFFAFLVLHLLKVMGAGDVKLMGMLGAFFGLERIPTLIVLVFAVGGLLVLTRLVDADRRRAVFANLRIIVFGRLQALAGHAGPQFDPVHDSADRLPYALAIAGGALLLAILQLAGVIA